MASKKYGLLFEELEIRDRFIIDPTDGSDGYAVFVKVKPIRVFEKGKTVTRNAINMDHARLDRFANSMRVIRLA